MSGPDRSAPWRAELDALADAGLRRQLRRVNGIQGREVTLDGARVLNFSSNNYLGLAGNREVVEANLAGVRRAGAGAGASRLIVGNMVEHELLERELAALHEVDAVLLFNTGYQANVGTLQAIAGVEDEVFSDALNHASVIDGCRLARAKVTVFPHGDLEALEQALSVSTARRKIVVSDAVFSMDGDRADVAALRALADRHEAVLMLDEAHAVGALGPSGRGVAAEVGVVADIHVGTLGKAFGSFGAYVAGPSELRELLLNRARSFVFTTALPPGVAAASRCAVSLARGPEGDELRRRLRFRIDDLSRGLARRGWLGEGAGTSAIFPILVGAERRAMECSAALLERGIYAQGIRPPTVPRGTSRLRVALMATHTPDDIHRLLDGLSDLASAGLLPEGS